jgi:hypothetical protein
VPDDAFYHDAVLWALSKNVTERHNADHLQPRHGLHPRPGRDLPLARHGLPEPAGKANPFTDVSSDAYYYKAVLWAVEQGITKGATAIRPSLRTTRSPAPSS